MRLTGTLSVVRRNFTYRKNVWAGDRDGDGGLGFEVGLMAYIIIMSAMWNCFVTYMQSV